MAASAGYWDHHSAVVTAPLGTAKSLRKINSWAEV